MTGSWSSTTVEIGIFDAATDLPGWRVELATQTSRPTVEDGQVYVGASDGTVHALDLDTGVETWHWDGPSGVPVRADVILDGVVYVATGDGRLILVDRQSGQEICTFPAARHARRRPPGRERHGLRLERRRGQRRADRPGGGHRRPHVCAALEVPATERRPGDGRACRR